MTRVPVKKEATFSKFEYGLDVKSLFTRYDTLMLLKELNMEKAIKDSASERFVNKKDNPKTTVDP